MRVCCTSQRSIRMASPLTKPSSREDEEGEDPFSQAETLVHEALDGPIKLLSERKERLLSEIRASRKEYNSKKKTSRDALDELRSSRDEMLSITSLMKENQAQGEMFKAIKNLEARITEQEELSPQLPEINFTCDTRELTDLIPTLGDIRLGGVAETGAAPPPEPTEGSSSGDKKPSRQFGMLGRKAGEVNNPNDICVDNENDRIYVTDMGKSLVHVFSLQGEYLREFGRGKMSGPHGVVSHAGHVYVTDFEVNTLFKFKHEEYELVKKTNSRTPDEQLNRPHGIEADRSELYVVEPYKHRISVFSTDLAYKGTLLGGVIKKAFSVRVLNRKLYVLEGRTNLIQVLDLQSGQVRKSVVIDEDGIPLFKANSFVFDSSENLFVTTLGGNFVKKIPKQGGFIQLVQVARWGVNDVRGVAIDKEDRVFVLFGRGPFCVAML